MAKATTIVVGNEKGGSGKTTTAVHIVTALIRKGYHVGVLDLDIRQQSLSRYLRNRLRLAQASGLPLPMPKHPQFRPLGNDPFPLVTAIKDLSTMTDIIVIDCPGNDNILVRTAHFHADIVVTPINDSYIDLDVIAELNGQGAYQGLGVYGEMVTAQRRRRLESWRLGQDWLVVRNRLSHISDANKRSLADKLAELSQRLDFTVTPGLSERVIFRQLFLAGLTVPDLDEPAFGIGNSRSHETAKQEVFAMLRAIRLPQSAQRPAAMAQT